MRKKNENDWIYAIELKNHEFHFYKNAKAFCSYWWYTNFTLLSIILWILMLALLKNTSTMYKEDSDKVYSLYYICFRRKSVKGPTLTSIWFTCNHSLWRVWSLFFYKLVLLFAQECFETKLVVMAQLLRGC